MVKQLIFRLFNVFDPFRSGFLSVAKRNLPQSMSENSSTTAAMFLNHVVKVNPLHFSEHDKIDHT